MRPRYAALCLAFAFTVASTVGAQQPPDYTVKIWAYFEADTLAEFARRVKSYVDLRASLEPGLPPLTVTTNPDEIDQAENALGRRIRRARAKAKRGDIFVPAIQAQIKKMLLVEVDQSTLASIADDNPGRFKFGLNGTYPKHRPVSTMPANLLQLLPPLPEGLEYRFVGRHLILRDMKANIILDDIPRAFRCDGCRMGEKE